MYAIIDGDDVGSKVEKMILTNDVEGFISESSNVTHQINRLVKGIEAIEHVNVESVGGDSLLLDLPENAERDITSYLERWTNSESLSVSAGLGPTLRDAFLALRLAKASGKGKVIHSRELE